MDEIVIETVDSNPGPACSSSGFICPCGGHARDDYYSVRVQDTCFICAESDGVAVKVTQEKRSAEHI